MTNNDPQSSQSPPTQQRADRGRQKALGRSLQRLYGGVIDEPVPDEFMALIEGMDEETPPKTGAKE